MRIPAAGNALLRTFVRSKRQKAERWRTQRVLQDFFAWLKNRRMKDVRAVSEAHLIAFLAWLTTQTNRRGQPVSDGQRQCFLTVLRGFFQFLVKRRVILVDPTQGISLPRHERIPPQVLSPSAVLKLMKQPAANKIGTRDRAIIELLYGTGLRLSECARLDLPDLSLGGRHLFVRSGKGLKDRVVPLMGRAANALSIYLKNVRPSLSRSLRESAVFLSRDGDRLAAGQIQKRLELHGQGAGLKMKLRPHLLRHTCATHLLAGGASIRHVQRLLGHRSLRTTEIYTRVGVEDLRQVFLRSHPRQ